MTNVKLTLMRLSAANVRVEASCIRIFLIGMALIPWLIICDYLIPGIACCEECYEGNVAFGCLHCLNFNEFQSNN